MRLLAFTVILALALAGMPRAAEAMPLIAKPGEQANRNIVEVWGGCGWGWRPVPGHWNAWQGWIPPHCAPARGWYWHHHYWWRHHWRHHHWHHRW